MLTCWWVGFVWLQLCGGRHQTSSAGASWQQLEPGKVKGSPLVSALYNPSTALPCDTMRRNKTQKPPQFEAGPVTGLSAAPHGVVSSGICEQRHKKSNHWGGETTSSKRECALRVKTINWMAQNNDDFGIRDHTRHPLWCIKS